MVEVGVVAEAIGQDTDVAAVSIVAVMGSMLTGLDFFVSLAPSPVGGLIERRV
jgi:hypothetical protein